MKYITEFRIGQWIACNLSTEIKQKKYAWMCSMYQGQCIFMQVQLNQMVVQTWLQSHILMQRIDCKMWKKPNRDRVKW